MAFQLLKGKPLSERMLKTIEKDVSDLKKSGIIPHIVAIQIGQNASSQIYMTQQKKTCEKADVIYEVQEFNQNVSLEEVSYSIGKMNNDKRITGIILQRPVPKNLEVHQLQSKISPDKDVEGIHPVNLGNLNYARTKIYPPTAAAVVDLLKSCEPDLKGKQVTIISHSDIVGKPLAMMLLQSEYGSPTVTVCHIATRDLKQHTSNADILISAAGVSQLIRKDMVKKDAIVIDVGINPAGTGTNKLITGDVDFENVKDICSYITPVPGGVGPVTVTMLLRNLIECGKKQASL